MVNETTEMLRHNIMHFLAARKFTQAEICEQLGHHRSWLTKFIRHGEPALFVADLDGLALALGIHVFQFFLTPEQQLGAKINHLKDLLNPYLPFAPGHRRTEVHPRNPRGAGHKDRGTFSRIPRKTKISLAEAILQRAERKKKLAKERYRKKKSKA